MGFEINSKTLEMSIPQCDTDYLELQITDDTTGLPIDITGSTICFTSKKLISDSTSLISKEVTEHVDSVNGLSKIEFNKDDTNKPVGRYLYEILIVFANGERKHIIKESYLSITPSLKGA